jgi:hypothetical protein
VAAQIGQRHREARLGQHARRIDVATAVISRSVHDRHARRAAHGRGELDDVQQHEPPRARCESPAPSSPVEVDSLSSR